MSELANLSDSQVQASSIDEEVSQARARIVIPVVASLIVAVIAWLDGLPILSAYQFGIPVIVL